MSTPELNLTSPAVVPSNGQVYHVVNAGFQDHVFDNANSRTENGNPVISYENNTDNGTNQNWSFYVFPPSSCNGDGDTAFTLQALNTIGSDGGYLNVDPATNKLVIGQPQAWKLIQVSSFLYKIAPLESFLYGDGTFVVTDVHEKTEVPNFQLNQMQLQKDTSSPEQLWVFQ